MSEKKEVKLVNKIKKSDLIAFNNVFSQVKVKGLEQQTFTDYLHLKIKTTEIIEGVETSRTNGIKIALKELGYNEGDKIPSDKKAYIEQKVSAAIKKLFDEEVELDTHVLTGDEFFNCILNIEENKDMTTEQKAVLMKYLVK